jgi:cell division topological specificity factor
VFGRIKNLFGGRASKTTAKNRLQMVLVQDRSGLTSAEMEKFRGDLLKVISRYFILERKALDIEWERADGSTALVINTPVMVKRKKSISTSAVAAAGVS